MMNEPAKQRMTRQRQVILDELMSRKDHPTADELYAAVRRKLPRISLGTVYRNLDVLMRSGLALKLDMGGAQSRFDADISPHYHVKCVSCGRVDDIRETGFVEITLPPSRDDGYAITGVRVEFDGICPQCRGRE